MIFVGILKTVRIYRKGAALKNSIGCSTVVLKFDWIGLGCDLSVGEHLTVLMIARFFWK